MYLFILLLYCPQKCSSVQLWLALIMDGRNYFNFEYFIAVHYSSLWLI